MARRLHPGRKWPFIVLIVLLLPAIIALTARGGEIGLESLSETLKIESSAFEHNGFIPAKYTGRGEDISPELTITDISSDALSIAIIMDDIDHPLMGIYNHWVIWNIPVQTVIPENIPHGALVDSLDGAIQGVGYGKHRYRGPKPPSFLKEAHRYQFHVFALDCILAIDKNSKKKDLLVSMKGHILQYGSLLGKFKNEQKE
jgi:Raf kinase inhibitor-like YbhB/YbcL family protein